MSKSKAIMHTWASKSPILGFRGGNTVHKRILKFVLYYIRFHLQGGGFPPLSFPYAHVWLEFYKSNF